MDKEKQIEEMAKVLCVGLNSPYSHIYECKNCIMYPCTCNERKSAEILTDKGYRKERFGEWIDTGDFELDNIYSGWKCSLCGYIFCGNKTNYCPFCGARMKGE